MMLMAISSFLLLTAKNPKSQQSGGTARSLVLSCEGWVKIVDMYVLKDQARKGSLVVDAVE
ncbi:hypothetical protein M758_1G212700 [Ceratodon purpureus]|nr:hypothetical protein M758_1G212700 [Ceratodon purpureus]